MNSLFIIRFIMEKSLEFMRKIINEKCDVAAVMDEDSYA